MHGTFVVFDSLTAMEKSQKLEKSRILFENAGNLHKISHNFT